MEGRGAGSFVLGLDLARGGKIESSNESNQCGPGLYGVCMYSQAVDDVLLELKRNCHTQKFPHSPAEGDIMRCNAMHELTRSTCLAPHSGNMVIVASSE